MTTFTTFIEERLAEFKKKCTEYDKDGGFIVYVEDYENNDFDQQLIEDFLTTTAHGAVEAFAEEVKEIIENSKIDTSDPKNLMTQILNEDMAVTDFPNVVNKMLDDIRSLITDLLHKK